MDRGHQNDLLFREMRFEEAHAGVDPAPERAGIRDEMPPRQFFHFAPVIGFFFARALQYKRSVFTFAAVVGGGVMIAFVAVYLLSYNYFELTDNFILNPAVALMYQILPTGAEGVGELLGKVALALLTYVIFPVIGGAVGFLVADSASILSEEEVKAVK